MTTPLGSSNLVAGDDQENKITAGVSLNRFLFSNFTENSVTGDDGGGGGRKYRVD